MARHDPTWAHLIEMEIEACREPGCLDMGTHLIAVCRKNAEPRPPEEVHPQELGRSYGRARS